MQLLPAGPRSRAGRPILDDPLSRGGGRAQPGRQGPAAVGRGALNRAQGAQGRACAGCRLDGCLRSSGRSRLGPGGVDKAGQEAVESKESLYLSPLLRFDNESGEIHSLTSAGAGMIDNFRLLGVKQMPPYG